MGKGGIVGKNGKSEGVEEMEATLGSLVKEGKVKGQRKERK